MLFNRQPIQSDLELHSLSKDGAGAAIQADTPLEFVVYAVILVFISALWYESDAYRYAAPLLVVPALAHYLRLHRSFPDRPRIGIVGLLCVAWGLYVAARYAYTVLARPDVGDGTSEGIYLLPLLYPTFGYALWLYVRRPFIIAVSFVLISFVVVLYGADIPSLTSVQRADFSLHQNPIHAAGATGMVVLCLLPFMIYVSRAKTLSEELRLPLLGIAMLAFTIGLINTYGLQSKGAWLALAIALPFQIILMLWMHNARATIISALVLAAFLCLALVFAWNGIWTVAGDTINAIILLVANIADIGLRQAVDHAISDQTLPSSFRQRLVLWASAVLIWGDNPLFGLGVAWEHIWNYRAHPQARFNLLHNGYLEIAIRYGVVGLSFYIVLFAWAIRRVWQASRYGLIDVTVFQAYVSILIFFCGTILTNSNVRLALGESYMMMAAGFGFYCFYLLQEHGYAHPKTWI